MNLLNNKLPAEYLLQQLPVSAFVINSKHQVIIWNKACEQLTGLTAEQILGTNQHWRGFYKTQRPCLADLLLDNNLDDLTRLYESSTSLNSLDEICHTENWCLMPDGRKLYLVIDASVIIDEKGTFLAVVETQRDRTEQRLMMQALRNSEERISSILASAMDAIITFDQQLSVTLFNPAAAKMFQCSADFALGQSIERFIAPNCYKLFQQFIDFDKSSLNNQTWVPEGLCARRVDGMQFPIEATFSPLEMDNQKIYTIILRDVNDRRLAERQLERLQQEKGYLQEALKYDHNPNDFISAAKIMRNVMDQVSMVAGTHTPVLLLGETGTGKELLARAIHEFSERSSAILVKVNCAALPAELIESELFGHEKGAFTGATQQRKGRFELADGGSLFLDEIGELSLSAQAKLLRVIQEKEFERVGGSEIIRTNVRLIAATNRDLLEEVNLSRFRADLYYRLNVFPILIPPLRQRSEDIPLLARFFLNKYAKKLGKRFIDIEPGSMEQLKQYYWPGNVRELQNVIERAVILSPEPTLEIETLVNFQDFPRQNAIYLTLDEVERKHIINCLEQTGWTISGSKGAATILGLNPNTLRSRMIKLGISKK